VSGTFGILVFVLSIIVVIVIHEAAHLGVAKAFGFKVEEFFVGFGPRIWSVRRGETEYGLKAIPAGGYVRIAGMDTFREVAPEDRSRSYYQKPRWQRALVIFAGPLTHLLMAPVFFALWFGAIGQPTAFSPWIVEVEEKLNGHPSPAFLAGIRPGDEVVGIPGVENPTRGQLLRYTGDNRGEPIELMLLRDERRFTVSLTPEWSVFEGQRLPRIGVAVALGRVLEREREGPITALKDGFVETGRVSQRFASGLGTVFGPKGLARIGDLLFGGAERERTDPASLVGGAQVAGELARSGYLADLVYMIGSLNVWVGLLNLLPLPPFDGGHLAVVAIEGATRKRIDPRRLIPVSAVVLSFFLLVTVSLIYLDIVKPLPDLFP